MRSSLRARIAFTPLLYSHDQHGFVFILNLHSTPCARLINRYVRMIFVEVGIVVLRLLPDLPVVQLKDRFTIPPFDFSGYCGLYGGNATTSAWDDSDRRGWFSLRCGFCIFFRLLRNGEIEGTCLRANVDLVRTASEIPFHGPVPDDTRGTIGDVIITNNGGEYGA